MAGIFLGPGEKGHSSQGAQPSLPSFSSHSEGEASIDRSLNGKTDLPRAVFVGTGQNSGGMCCDQGCGTKTLEWRSSFSSLSFSLAHSHNSIQLIHKLSLSHSITNSFPSPLSSCVYRLPSRPSDGQDAALSFSRNHRCRQDRLRPCGWAQCDLLGRYRVGIPRGQACPVRGRCR